jgi:hypothetical protein
VLRSLTQELQSELNYRLLDTLHAAEEEDWYRFGKVRIARDKRFKQPAQSCCDDEKFSPCQNGGVFSYN